MDYRENLRMSCDTLLAHKFRSFLTILGIVVGIVVVIVIASILAGLRQSIVSELESIGTNNIYAFHRSMMQIGPPRRNRDERLRKPLTVADAIAINEQCDAVQDVAWRMPGMGMMTVVQYRNNRLRNADFSGVSANFGMVANVNIADGRFFSDSEDRHRLPVVVIGPDAAEAMFGDADPIGKDININGHPFTVIGVTEKSKTSVTSESNDSAVLIPYGTMRKMAPSWVDWHLLYIQAKSDSREKAMDEVEGLLRRRRNVGYNEANNFDLMTAEQVIQKLDSITAMLGAGMIAISSVGLLVGGIGVMNIMLVSVTERTREIGVRKAIGATRKDIVLQFLFEAMTLSGIGGVFGIIVAAGLCGLMALVIPALPVVVPLWAVFTGLGVSIAIGLIFGVWPARKAAGLDPIEALRYE